MIRTVIAEDNIIMQKYLADVLAGEGEFHITALCRDAFEAERLCQAGDVDLALMDVQTLHNHSGLAAGERIRRQGKGAKVVVVTSLVDPEVLSKARSGGADSLWYKDHGGADLLSVIRRTLAGERVFPDASPSVELKEMFSQDITPRQLAILRRFVMGMTYEEIAAELKLTPSGVRWNLQQIIDKGGFKNRHELLAAVIENKLVVTTLLDTEETESP